MKHDIKIKKANENIFAELGIAHPERVRARAIVMHIINQVIKSKGWSQKQAAAALKMPQSKISCLMNGKLSLFSMERLFEILNVLDKSVEIVIKKKPLGKSSGPAHVTVLNKA